jgi:hypothetical protein
MAAVYEPSSDTVKNWGFAGKCQWLAKLWGVKAAIGYERNVSPVHIFNPFPPSVFRVHEFIQQRKETK